MNRRNLAKKGFLGLCAFLFGKLPAKKVVPYAITWTHCCPDSSTNWYGFDLSGPEWDDGAEIEHG